MFIIQFNVEDLHPENMMLSSMELISKKPQKALIKRKFLCIMPEVLIRHYPEEINLI